MTNKRCDWVGSNDPINTEYHDKEWGVPVHDDRVHFEFLTLEGAQAGLSWITILKRREGYRKAFANFDFNKVATFDEQKIAELLRDPGIIRNRLKVLATINNARRFIEIRTEFGSFDRYIWSFVHDEPIVNKWKNLREMPAKTDLSDKISKDLRKRGFKFVGSTIIYAYLQACGLINDHVVDCFRHSELLQQ